MKTVSKQTNRICSIILVVVFVVFISSIVPVNIANAEDSSASNPNKQDFCKNIDNINNSINNTINNKIDYIDSQKNTQKKQIKSEILSKQKDINNLRRQWDKNREDQINQLKQKYKKDKNKIQAIEEFDLQVDVATKNRREKNDNILEEYDKEVEKQVIIRNENLQAVIKSYQNTIIDAQKTAQGGCNNGDNSMSTRTQFKSNLLLAKNQLINGNGGVSEYKKSVAEIANKKQLELKAVAEEFQTTIESAINKLANSLR